MNHKSTLSIPEPILHLQHPLDQFRSSQPRRTKLPEPLWQAAVERARQHGVYPVAHPLRLDYVHDQGEADAPADVLAERAQVPSEVLRSGCAAVVCAARTVVSPGRPL